YETGSQLRTASKSISANIVEGYARRRYKAEFIRFLTYSHSSCSETIEWVEYIRDCHQELKEECEKFLVRLDKLGRKINRFISAVEKDHKVGK
ncbi:MAG: four helix bundle protein, partial [Pseudomonadota bacterium]